MTVPTGGTATIDAEGRIVVSPTQAGVVTLTYAANDGTALSAPALVQVTAQPAPTRDLKLTAAILVSTRSGGGLLTLGAQVDGNMTTCPTLKLSAGNIIVFDLVTARVGKTKVCLATTNKGVVKVDMKTGNVAVLYELPKAFTLPSNNRIKFTFLVNGTTYSADVSGKRLGLIWISS